MRLHPVEAFSDNYIWVLDDGQRALVVDPGDAAPVKAHLARHGLVLDTILITHHHPDHVAGVAALQTSTGAAVIGPATESLPVVADLVHEGDCRQILGLTVTVLDVPGHTAGHVAYLIDDRAVGQPVLFCGDTLFSGGCGRLFEGSPAQMLASLDRLAALPPATRVCAAHEYTLSNLAFAVHVEPGNANLIRYQEVCETLRARQQPTLPSSIGQECLVNPFLRVREPDVISRVADHANLDETGPESIFAALREWKNHYR